jgi:hypothetical protein
MLHLLFALCKVFQVNSVGVTNAVQKLSFLYIKRSHDNYLYKTVCEPTGRMSSYVPVMDHAIKNFQYAP